MADHVRPSEDLLVKPPQPVDPGYHICLSHTQRNANVSLSDSTLTSPEVLLYLSDNLDMRVREGRGLKGGAATSPLFFFLLFYLNSTETQHG